MANHLLIIGDAPAHLEPVLGADSSPLHGVICTRLGWSSLRPESLQEHAANLIVPIIRPEIAASGAFLAAASEKPILKATLAILSRECDQECFDLASRAFDDFVSESAVAHEIRHRLGRLVAEPEGEAGCVRNALIQELGLAQMVGRDPRFLDQVGKIPRLARSGSPVLICGESGTGKELCAHAIHNLSTRRNQPFIPLDCGAFPDHLFENELFGHARGAYTDANRDQKGLVALAEGGTLFLDEVDSLSPAAQSKLLRFLQERTYRPLGSERFVRADIRLLAATNRDLEALVKAKQFRLDLYFRLCVLKLQALPLRERRGDIVVLANHFLDEICERDALSRKSLASTTIRILNHYHWPGNVRELYNVMEQCVTFTEGMQIQPRHLPGQFEQARAGASPISFNQARSRALEDFERSYVESVLRDCGGNVTHAARLAQKERRMFGRMVKRYNLKGEGPP
jgi:two-component system response regulator GlrR